MKRLILVLSIILCATFSLSVSKDEDVSKENVVSAIEYVDNEISNFGYDSSYNELSKLEPYNEESVLRSDEEDDNLPIWAVIFFVFLGVVAILVIYETIDYYLSTIENKKVKEQYDPKKAILEYIDNEKQTLTAKFYVMNRFKNETTYEIDGEIKFSRNIEISDSTIKVKVDETSYDANILKKPESERTYNLALHEIDMILDYTKINILVDGEYIDVSVRES